FPSLGLAPRVLTPSSFRLAGDHRDARAIDGDIQDRHGGNQRRHFARYDSLSLALAESFDLLTQLHGDSFHLFGPHDHASQCFQVPTTLLEGFFGPTRAIIRRTPGLKELPTTSSSLSLGAKPLWHSWQ